MIVVEGAAPRPARLPADGRGDSARWTPRSRSPRSSSGARPLSVLRRVTLAARPARAVARAVLMVAMRALESFEVPALLGIPAGVWVFTSRIWRALGEYPLESRRGRRLRAVAARAHGARRPAAQSHHAARSALQTVTGKGFRPRPMPLGRWRWPMLGARLRLLRRRRRAADARARLRVDAAVLHSGARPRASRARRSTTTATCSPTDWCSRA